MGSWDSRSLIILPIRAYRYVVSPWLGPCCRFHPTCSRYAIEAISEHGVLRGCWLAARRLLKCHPLHPGGEDPVPQSGPAPSKPYQFTGHTVRGRHHG